jgi:hypothetical protein
MACVTCRKYVAVIVKSGVLSDCVFFASFEKAKKWIISLDFNMERDDFSIARNNTGIVWSRHE